MELDLIQYCFLLIASAATSGLLTPLMRKVAFRFQIVDAPNQLHKTHKEPIPYLGGVAIILSILLIALIGSIFTNVDSGTRLTLLAILIPATIIGTVGLIDDIKNLSPFSRFIAQTLSGILTALIIIKAQTVGSPTGNSILDFSITVLWIVGVTNSINFFDNHDGGASGTVAISSLGLFILSFISGQYYIAALAIVSAGSAMGFLVWNRNPARIYMGDAGSLFLGMMLASLLVRFDPSPINRWAGFAIPILLLALPIMDTTVAVLSRIKRGISPFQGGQDHLSHRLVRRGLSRRKTAYVLWGATANFVFFAFLISNVGYAFEGVLLLATGILWLVMFSWFWMQPHSLSKK